MKMDNSALCLTCIRSKFAFTERWRNLGPPLREDYYLLRIGLSSITHMMDFYPSKGAGNSKRRGGGSELRMENLTAVLPPREALNLLTIILDRP